MALRLKNNRAAARKMVSPPAQNLRGERKTRRWQNLAAGRKYSPRSNLTWFPKDTRLFLYCNQIQKHNLHLLMNRKTPGQMWRRSEQWLRAQKPFQCPENCAVKFERTDNLRCYYGHCQLYQIYSVWWRDVYGTVFRLMPLPVISERRMKLSSSQASGGLMTYSGLNLMYDLSHYINQLLKTAGILSSSQMWLWHP